MGIATTLLNTLKLLLPALIPSWRFFEVVAASPRIEIATLQTKQTKPSRWTEVRPKPTCVPVRTMLKRLFWNPYRNESLFLVSCAERMLENPTDHSQQEILKRVITDLERDPAKAPLPPYLQFRLVFVSRNKTRLQRRVRYTSPIFHINSSTEE